MATCDKKTKKKNYFIIIYHKVIQLDYNVLCSDYTKMTN